MTTATRSSIATDSRFEPEERLIIAVFNRARKICTGISFLKTPLLKLSECWGLRRRMDLKQ